MSFFGIGKKKWDEQAREAESTAAQDGHEESKPSRGSGLSDKIMEQQQWEDSLRRFVKSEGTRQNRDEERSEEYRAVEDLKRALLHDDEETPSFTEGSLSNTGKTTDEEERRSILEALNSYPHGDSEAAAAPEAREESNDSEAVEDAPAAPETPAFLRDDEDETSEKTEGDSSAKAEPSTDTAEDARSQFEEHLRAVRAESSAEESPATSDVDDTDRNAAAEEYLSAEQIREARTRAAIIEAKSAGLDDLAAVYAARLGLNPESEEGSFEEVEQAEQAEESEAVAAKQPAAEHSASERSTEPESLSAEPTRSGEKTEPAAEVLVSETATVEELSEPASEPAEPSNESEEKLEVAKDEAKKDTEDPASEPGSDEAASGEQKLSADDAELVAESIVLTAPAEGAADLPVLGEQRALHSLTELMRTRGSGTLSLELRQVDEDMHYRLLHRGREVENGIVLPGVDWFAPVAALYTEAQEAGATWNRAAVTLNPRLGEGLEVHASYLGAVDGQTTHESFLLETPAREETSVVATAEAAEAAEAHQAEAAEAEASESDDSQKVEPETPVAEAQPSEEVREEQAPEQVERQSAPAGLAVAGATVAGAAALAASASESGEASVAEPEYEHDYDNDPIFGTANSQDAEATSAQPEQPEVSEADEDTEPVHAQPDAAEAEDAEAEAVDHGEEMEAALAAIVANAQEKLDEPQEPEETSTEAAAFVSVEESAAPAEASVAESSDAEASNAESSAAESSAYEAPAEKGEKTVEEAASTDAEPELPTFLDDRELVPADEAEEPSKTAKAEEPEPAQARSEKAEAPAPAVTGALAAAAAVAAGGAAASAAPVASSAASSAVPSAPSTPVLSEFNELPTVADEPDTPASQPVSPLVPSETQLAEGNLVLTEAQVAQRLAPVVEHLFGENGTAKDATTVLIRVRALGSYYDALTHVRRNGFWEQARTFELIPETLLDIPALKTDSYSEGEGSPLAMSLTFTPGVPVQAAFDYANEQAFVSYPRPLDAERYVEELRMFPRLGSKIPAHMTSALSHWNL